MKVSTDSVLLGAWAKVSKAYKILDVGTGTGVIALMMAQKSNAKIFAIEIDENSVQQAKENFEKSKYSLQINLEKISLQEFSKKSRQKFDLIITNPPYFSNSLKSMEPPIGTTGV